MTFIMSSLGPFGLAPLKAVGLAEDRVETRALDGSEYNTTEPVIGPSKGRWWIASLDEIEKDSLLDAQFHGKGTWPEGSHVLRMSIRSLRSDPAKAWGAEHIWGFEDIGSGGQSDIRYVARMKVFRGPEDRKEEAHARLIYDYVGNPRSK